MEGDGTLLGGDEQQTQLYINRQGDAYVGLYSWRPVQYREENGSLLNPGSPAQGDLRDIVAHGVQNVWICEVFI